MLVGLPLTNLVALVLRQVARPIANVIKRTVKTNSFLTKCIIAPAKGFHQIEQTIRVKVDY